MRDVTRSGWRVGAAVLALVTTMAEREALACGGCFTPPPTTETESVITDEKMVLSVSMTQTTLYDQINYSGSPASFAWVLPIKGTVTVGLSADVMFQVINTLTATQVQAPPLNCAPPPDCYGGADSSGGGGSDSSGGGGSDSSGVTVTAQQQVGPYESVQLHSTDGSALTAWLTQHGYQIPDSTKPVIDAYVAQQFDFLALKLVPGQGVQSMQPVRVTSQGAAPSLPLHMVAIGTGATTGITIWVVASGRWAPTNFKTFTIADSELVWDWTTMSSNYESLRLSKESSLHGAGWQIESSLDLSQYTVQQALLSNIQYTTQGGYTSLPSSPADGGTVADAGAPDQTASANADLAVLFQGIAGPNARITRMRSDIAQSALSVDMALGASSDQSELSNFHQITRVTGTPPCTVYPSCSTEGTDRSTTGLEEVSTSETSASAQATSSNGGCTAGPTSDTTFGLLLAVGSAVALRGRRKKRA